MQKIIVAPEYLSFYIAGSRGVTVPLDNDRRGIVSTQDCINVGCLYWNDGDTTIWLGSAAEMSRPETPTFDGLLNTLRREILLFDANLPEIARVQTETTKTRVRIWTNHPTEPDEVFIATGG